MIVLHRKTYRMTEFAESLSKTNFKNILCIIHSEINSIIWSKKGETDISQTASKVIESTKHWVFKVKVCKKEGVRQNGQKWCILAKISIVAQMLCEGRVIFSQTRHFIGYPFPIITLWGHVQTTWTEFWTILTPTSPYVDTRHFY